MQAKVCIFKGKKTKGLLLFYKEMTKIHFSLTIRILLTLYENFSCIDAKSRMVVARDRVVGGGEVGSCWSKGTKFQLHEMNTFW